jgi:hypothetical protein
MHLDKQVAQNAFDLENQMNMFFKLLISHFEYMQFYYTQATQVFFFFFYFWGNRNFINCQTIKAQ